MRRADASAAGDFKQLAGAKGRVMVTTIACGGLTLKMELYFHPDPAPGDPVVTGTSGPEGMGRKRCSDQRR